MFFTVTSIHAQSGFSLSSPDHTISVDISLKEKIYYSVSFKEERVLEASPLSINIDNTVLLANPVIVNTKNT
ncbi:MAG: glycoside hydrolase family 97 N-terminal domain-containing protein [Ferruginibacter sp.]|nr:glycoside hydrolase family 97 N-terminal domain-containing protein [Ferruginibacter sp.]